MYGDLNENLNEQEPNAEGSQDPMTQWMKRHQNQNNRRLHFIGWLIGLLILVQAIFTFELTNIFYSVLFIVGCSFCGHYFCEGNAMDFSDPKASAKCHLRLCEMIVKR